MSVFLLLSWKMKRTADLLQFSCGQRQPPRA